MQLKRLHKIIGIILTLPLLGWALTGIVFLTKPGYGGAYEVITIPTYPLEQTFSVNPQSEWHEARLLRTILGYHLLLETPRRWLHLDPVTQQKRTRPSQEGLKRLVGDAIRVNPERYGEVEGIDDGIVTTTTGVEIELNWQTLSLTQTGSDTRLINTLYKVHYLQWWGEKTRNTVFGVLGIILLLLLVLLGITNLRDRSS